MATSPGQSTFYSWVKYDGPRKNRELMVRELAALLKVPVKQLWK